MSIFDILNMTGGLCVFLFGMTVMGDALKHRAGEGLKSLIGKLTEKTFTGLLTGIGVTAVIQSSSATTVIVVGFVNSGIMTLGQSIPIIMGANIGTTITAWVLSLTGIESDSFFVSLLKPSAWTPILALIGIIFYFAAKNGKKKDTGLILLGFSTLMFGMETMTSAVSGLSAVPQFRQLFVAFANPFLGVLMGAVLTAVIQSSSASVGILQAFCSTGAVTYAAAVPIIMGQNIGTCVTAMLSSIGANKNARRAALVHLSYNVIGTLIWLSVFITVKTAISPAVLSASASLTGIAAAHTAFNVLCMVIMLPFIGQLEKLVCVMVRDADAEEGNEELDERLLNTPSLALLRCGNAVEKLAKKAVTAMKESLALIEEFDPEKARFITEAEAVTDHLEDILGTYLIKVTSRGLNPDESMKATEYMKLIGDYERIADHAVNILESSKEMEDKGVRFSDEAMREYHVISSALKEVLDLSFDASVRGSVSSARKTEPLEQVIDSLKEILRTRHILRLQRGECSVESGFIWTDILTNIERVSDHCSNISGCVIDATEHNMNTHQNLKQYKENDSDFAKAYDAYSVRYNL